jgi:hypothetical protein
MKEMKMDILTIIMWIAFGLMIGNLFWGISLGLARRTILLSIFSVFVTFFAALMRSI